MKPITVYRMIKEEVMSYGYDTITMYEMYNPNLSRVSEDTWIEPTIETKDWKIKRYRWSDGREIYAAIDPELIQMLDIEIEETEKFKWERTKLLKELKQADKKIEDLVTDVENHTRIANEYVNMSLWQRLKFLFTGGL